ncbi:MAG: 50S ribosomal protein L15 [Anaerolineaceae bacterium]|nr:50S ribosomal protein L15 [Anaerolineaceae bacterium]MBN2676533.1 50S ribosomal protein L15 [Anaerolineaceae bacterium]
MKLNDLVPTEGSKKPKNRVGRGISAGQGKTAGRGTKGQGSRAGKPVRLYHQGGNLPFFRRLPFMRGKGFTSLNRIDYIEVNLSQLASLPSGSEVTTESLAKAGVIRKAGLPVVILGNGELTVPLKVRVQRVSKSAKAKIEKAGGSVEII